MKGLIFLLFATLSLHVKAQTIDARVLRHYSLEDLLDMDSLKFESVKYYYCHSYILDTTKVDNFNISEFDIRPFEDLRHKEEFVTVERKNGLKITLIPTDSLLHKLAVKSYFIIE